MLIYRTWLSAAAFILFLSGQLVALEKRDQGEIQEVIARFQDSWNGAACRDIGTLYTADADFINIYGMHFSGRQEIQERHVYILETFLKGSTFTTTAISLREVSPGLVIAIVDWQVDGFRPHAQDQNEALPSQKGRFTHVFVQDGGKWLITASQNTVCR